MQHEPFSKEELELIDKVFDFDRDTWVKLDEALLSVIYGLKSGRAFIGSDNNGHTMHTPEFYEAFKLYKKIKLNYEWFLVLQDYINHKIWESIQ